MNLLLIACLSLIIDHYIQHSSVPLLQSTFNALFVTFPKHILPCHTQADIINVIVIYSHPITLMPSSILHPPSKVRSQLSKNPPNQIQISFIIHLLYGCPAGCKISQ